MNEDDVKKSVLKALLTTEATAEDLIKGGSGVGPHGYGVYPVLRALVASRLIATREVPDKSGRARIFYMITDFGRLAAMGEQK